MWPWRRRARAVVRPAGNGDAARAALANAQKALADAHRRSRTEVDELAAALRRSMRAEGQ